MVRIVRRAHAKECDWSENVDVTALQSIMTATLQDNPCLSTVEGRLAASADDEKEQQADVFLASMGMLLTGECEAQPMAEAVEGSTVVEPQSIDDADEQVEELVEDLMDVAVGADDEAAAAAALLQVSGAQPAQVAEASLRLWPPPFWTGVDRWLIHTPDVVNPLNPGQVLIPGSTNAIQSAGPQTAQQWITHGLGVAAWLIGFALLCTTAVYLFALILGALLCLLRSLLLVLLMRQTSLRTCLNTAVATVQRQQGAIGFVGGVCLAGGAGLMTTRGGVVGQTVIR